MEYIRKQRLVVRGFRQIKGVLSVDYTRTYSLTIEMESFKLTIAIAFNM